MTLAAIFKSTSIVQGVVISCDIRQQAGSIMVVEFRAVLFALLLCYTLAIESSPNNASVASSTKQLKPDLDHVSVGTASVGQKQHLKPQTAAATMGPASVGAAVPSSSKLVRVISPKTATTGKQQLPAQQHKKATKPKTAAKQQSIKAAYDGAEYSEEYAEEPAYANEKEERECWPCVSCCLSVNSLYTCGTTGLHTLPRQNQAYSTSIPALVRGRKLSSRIRPGVCSLAERSPHWLCKVQQLAAAVILHLPLRRSAVGHWQCHLPICCLFDELTPCCAALGCVVQHCAMLLGSAQRCFIAFMCAALSIHGRAPPDVLCRHDSSMPCYPVLTSSVLCCAAMPCDSVLQLFLSTAQPGGQAPPIRV